MSYMHIDNLDKAQEILLFRRCFAMEKIHGTSAHIIWRDSKLMFFAGGVKHEAFVKLFDQEALAARFVDLGCDDITVYGEAYGGKIQHMSATYGPVLKFVVFEVKMGKMWLNVPAADEIAIKIGLDFVPWCEIETTLEEINQERDRVSTQSLRNGVEGIHMREGIVLRPLIEVTMNNGKRIIAKWKRPEFSERKTNPSLDSAKRQVLEAADAIAEEWVTDMRLQHVLDALGNPKDMTACATVIKAMIEDVQREAKGEIVESKAARKAIGGRAVKLYKQYVQREAEASIQ